MWALCSYVALHSLVLAIVSIFQNFIPIRMYVRIGKTKRPVPPPHVERAATLFDITNAFAGVHLGRGIPPRLGKASLDHSEDFVSRFVPPPSPGIKFLNMYSTA